MRIVFIGLTITSAWGNGHATTYRGLVRGLARRGHDVLFLEHDKPWYAANRDLPDPPFGRTALYQNVADLKSRFAAEVAAADAVIVGSYVPQGVEVGEWALKASTGVRAFYDIDTPVTLAKLARGDHEYISRALIPKYDIYLSFAGGPTLDRLENEFGSPAARALFCSVDPESYFPEAVEIECDLGYLGTYSDDRQPTVQRLLIDVAKRRPAMRFAVAGPQYPASVEWPANVGRIEHLPPERHRGFYNSQRFALNVTRADMIAAGWSPSVRLFEAAACGVPVISDEWPGLGEVFILGREILTARTTADVEAILADLPEADRRAIGAAARATVLRHHTAAARAAELENYLTEFLGPN